ncbi:MAG: prepilin-type N-terminal cleavage/methylation domain-containing protein [Deltaproteobacteria bacterium]|nr:prepilin-type N-terminal cleavage/methylation domain-containing protein [Candidatus Desulfobacula maris]MBL6995998.1 prepilin-type N-terminal cleavage/methylation domain-containing protein [Desulfobacula sp.]
MQRHGLTANCQKGFTLIEIIAVLTILGILSALAIPKYMYLQNEARIKSGQSAISEIKTRLSNAYGQYLLANQGTAPSNIAAICNLVNDTSILPANANGNIPLGNGFTATLSDGLITITIVDGVSVSGVTGTWTMPN